MLVVVIYNEFINETLNLVNEYTYTHTFIHSRILAPEKFIAHIMFKMR